MAEAARSLTRGFFEGTVDTSILFPYPRISDEEDARVSAFLAELTAYLEREVDREWIDEHEQVPQTVIDDLRRMGLFSISIPAEYGGMGLSQSAYCRVFEAVTAYDVGLGIILGVHLSIGIKGILLAGTDAQKRLYLPKAATGEWFASFALTEPGAGSDALRGMGTTARRAGDSWVLNGSKTFITNAPYADVFLIYARTIEGDAPGAIQPFIVERGTPGLSTGPAMKKMGMRGSPTGEVFLDDVRVPSDQLLGGGVRERDHVKASLAVERGGLSVMSYGIAERCFEIARDYALERRQFGQPIASFQLVQQRLARMYVAVSNCRRIVYADWLAGRTLKESIADVCAGKLYCAEMGTYVAFEAIHILAGNGYMEEYVVERLARDAKLIELGGGTTEMQILTIARELLLDRDGGSAT